MKRFMIAVLAIPMVLAGSPQTEYTLPPGEGVLKHLAHVADTMKNAELPSWLAISSNDVSSITIQGWGPGADGSYTVYPAAGTSRGLINTLMDGLSNAKAIKPYQTPISQGGAEWMELKIKNGSTISLATFPNDPKPTQYIVALDDKSQGPLSSIMIRDVSGKVASVFHEIAKGTVVRQKTR